jgi:hypothetical protein
LFENGSGNQFRKLNDEGSNRLWTLTVVVIELLSAEIPGDQLKSVNGQYTGESRQQGEDNRIVLRGSGEIRPLAQKDVRSTANSEQLLFAPLQDESAYRDGDT